MSSVAEVEKRKPHRLNAESGKASPQKYNLQQEEIGCYRLGRFFSESFSGIPYENDISAPIGIGREDSFNPYVADPGGPQKTFRIIVLLHETAHLVHDLSLGACMEVDYLTDKGLGAFLEILHRIPATDPILCPILKGKGRNHLKQTQGVVQALTLLEDSESLANALLSHPSDLQQFAGHVNSVFTRFPNQLEQISGQSLLEGIVAVKTLVSITLRIKNGDDISYLEGLKESTQLLPERLPTIYTAARKLFDGTIGEMLGISTKYYEDAWPRSYSSSPRSISDEGFLYLADMALHIPPFEYLIKSIREGRNQLDDFIPAKRFLREIDALLRKGYFPPIDDCTSSNQFYRTVFDFLAKELGWPSYEETNFAWLAKITAYKQARQEAVDGYRFRMLSEKHQRPSEIVMTDAFDACMKQLIPIFHLTPIGLKKLGGFATESHRVYTPFEERDIGPYFAMARALPLWKDAPREATIDVLPAEWQNQDLFRQEIVYRIVARELKDAVLYDSHFKCPLAGLGCDVSLNECQSITRLDTIPKERCCVRFYTEQKQLKPSRICWLQ